MTNEQSIWYKKTLFGETNILYLIFQNFIYKTEIVGKLWYNLATRALWTGWVHFTTPWVPVYQMRKLFCRYLEVQG